MAVNALMTSLIVFKILKVFLEFKPTSVELTLGSLSSMAGGSKLRHVIFIIIESGMALFAIQLVRVVLTSLVAQTGYIAYAGPAVGMNLVIGIHQVLNVIIRSFHFYFFCFTDDIYLARASRQQ
jgi:TRAP-type mannitol/chloroaromatic compound transport system permease small subunit